MSKKRISEGVTSKDPQSSRWRTKFSAARMAYENGEYRKAESLLAVCVELTKEMPERDFARKSTDAAIGVVYLSSGRIREAESQLQKSISSLEGEPDPQMQELLAVTLRFYAQVLIRNGDERGAETELLRSVDILKKIGRQSIVQLALTLCDLCGLYASQGRYSEAERYIVDAMKIMGAEFGPGAAEYVRTDMIYTLLTPMADESRLDTASESIRRMEYAFGGKHPNVARALERYFKVLGERGDTARIEEAEKQFGITRKELVKEK
jgi:tetratricopeptide (TPR) repeat protein